MLIKDLRTAAGLLANSTAGAKEQTIDLKSISTCKLKTKGIFLGREFVSYQGLFARANDFHAQIREYIFKNNINNTENIFIYLKENIDVIATILGSLKLNKNIIVLSKDDKNEKIDACLHDGCADILVTNKQR